MGFAKYMVISKHIDESCEGRQNYHILEDMYEAFLGAIYLDTGDLEKVKAFVIQSIETHVDIVDLISKDNNYKDQILRYFQHNFRVHPVYKTEKTDSVEWYFAKYICAMKKGDSSPFFPTTVYLHKIRLNFRKVHFEMFIKPFQKLLNYATNTRFL